MLQLSELSDVAHFPNKRHKLRELSMKQAHQAYAFLFPDRREKQCLSIHILIHRIALELKYDPVVIHEMCDGDEKKLAKLLASESIGPDKLEFDKAMNLRKQVVEGYNDKVNFIETARKMGHVEAFFFWRHVLDVRPRLISPYKFLCRLSWNEIDKKAIRKGMSMFDRYTLIHHIFHSPQELEDAKWWSSEFVNLNKKTFTPWGVDSTFNIKEYNGGYYIPVPRGVDVEFKMQFVDDCYKVWLEGWSPYNEDGTLDTKTFVVIDAIWPHAPEMDYMERMAFIDKTDLEVEVYPKRSLKSPFYVKQMPLKLPSWKQVIKETEDFHIRIPKMSAYDPYEKDGYIIVKDRHILPLRVSFVDLGKNWVDDNGYRVGLTALDGVDYTYVGDAFLKELRHKTNLFGKLRMVVGPEWSQKEAFTIPEEHCIVALVASPYMESGELVTPEFMGFADDLGQSDVIQIVDILGSPGENLIELMESWSEE